MSDTSNVGNTVRKVFGINHSGKGRRDPLNILVPLVAIALALLVGMVVIAASGRNPFVAYKLLFGGSGLFPHSASTVRDFSNLLVKSALFIAPGLAVAFAFQGGLFNIGAEGQFWVGAIVATLFGYLKPFASFPPILHSGICLIMGMIAGGLWGALAGYIKVKRGVNEVITTIMLNWIAWYLITNWLVIGPMTPKNQVYVSGSYYITDSAKLRNIIAVTHLNTSILLALLAAYVAWFILYKTTIGYEIRAIGHTAAIGMEAPRAQGINVNKRLVQTMFISGCLAAMGGAFFILGVQYQFPNTAVMGYGWTGISIALIGQSEPFGVVLAGLFIGALRTGATSIQVANIPKTFSDLIEGLAVGFIALQVAVRYYLTKLSQRHHKTVVPPTESKEVAA